MCGNLPYTNKAAERNLNALKKQNYYLYLPSTYVYVLE